MCMCVSVSVCLLVMTSDMMWSDVKLIGLVKQVLRFLYGSYRVSLVGMALQLKCVVESNLIRAK